MPWRETCRVDQRKKFIEFLQAHRTSMAAACRVFGISRQTGHKWKKRFREKRSLDERSRRPKSHPRTTPGRLVKLILSQRKQFPRWGPVPIRRRLQTVWPEIDWPAASTIGSILKRNGTVTPRRFRKRVAPRTRPFAS